MKVWTFAWDDKNGTGCSVHLTEREQLTAFIEHVAEAGSDEEKEAKRILDEEEGDGLWDYLEENCFEHLATFGLEQDTLPDPKVIVVLEGGLVTGILSTLPVEAAVIDYDTEDAMDEEHLTFIPQGEDEPEVEAFASIWDYSVEVKPERTEQLWEAIRKGEPCQSPSMS